MTKANPSIDENSADARITRALADAEIAKRRATMALKTAKIALNYSLSTPKIGALIKEIDEELQKG